MNVNIYIGIRNFLEKNLLELNLVGWVILNIFSNHFFNF